MTTYTGGDFVEATTSDLTEGRMVFGPYVPGDSGVVGDDLDDQGWVSVHPTNGSQRVLLNVERCIVRLSDRPTKPMNPTVPRWRRIAEVSHLPHVRQAATAMADADGNSVTAVAALDAAGQDAAAWWLWHFAGTALTDFAWAMTDLDNDNDSGAARNGATQLEGRNQR